MTSGKMHRDRLEQIAIFLQLLDGSFDLGSLGRSQAGHGDFMRFHGAQLGNTSSFLDITQLQDGGIVDIQSPFFLEVM